MSSKLPQLLAPDEPPAFQERGRDGASDFVIIVDHASNLIPRRLGSLGLTDAELQRHIAWDIGALGVAYRASEILDAHMVAQNYSRLVIDCNRDPAQPSSIATLSEWTTIPGNAALSDPDIEARRCEIFHPYHQRISAVIDERQADGRKTIVVAQHTMTDVYKDEHRPMHAAVLYDREPEFARAVLDALRRQTGLTIADNQPYFLSDASDYTVPRHAEARALPYVEIEIRQDLVADKAGQMAWGERVAAALVAAQAQFANR